ncbi:MAG: PLP-dependent aminotransferase family protein [Bacteroidota bacterium]
MRKFKHELVAEQFIELIEGGEIKAGDKLPSLRTLSKQQGISLMTVYHAISTLEGLGYVVSRPKSGYYARKPLKKNDFSANKIFKKKKDGKRIDELVQRVYGKMDSENMIYLSMNVPATSLLPETKLKKSLLYINRRKSNTGLQYGPITGVAELSKQIAILMGHSGINVYSDELIITAGCMEAINLAISACTKPGDKILIESPTYFGIFQAIISQGRVPVEVETDYNNGIVVRSLYKAVEIHKPKACILIASYSSPLGATIPDDMKKEIVGYLAKQEVTLIENDIYGELYYGKQRTRACKSFDQTDSVIYCSSFSKSLAPGYRVGWIQPGKYYNKVFQAKLHQSVTTSNLTQEILAHFLKNGRYDLHLKRMRKQLHTQSLKYQQAITHFFPNDTAVTKPEGGFVLWVELNRTINTLKLYDKAIDHGISFAPGQLFSLEKDLHNYLRISIGQPYSASIEKALEKLGKLIQQEIYV